MYNMSCTKMLFITASALLFLFIGKPVAFAQDIEPDFSNFDDPNAKPVKKAKSVTEAEPPCLTCNTSHPKPKNLTDNEAVAKAGMNQNKKTAAKKSQSQRKQVECITCNAEKEPEYPKGKVDSSWSQFPKIAAYSNSPQVAKMLEVAKRNKYSTSHKRCYRFVKGALCGLDKKTVQGTSTSKCAPGSMVSSYPSGSRVSTSNSSAITTLERYGFTNLLTHPETKGLIKNPASAPKGAILIYKGGRNGGHIEIKTGVGSDPDYISDFSAPNSILRNDLAGRASKNYQLVGVMVKENL